MKKQSTLAVGLCFALMIGVSATAAEAGHKKRHHHYPYRYAKVNVMENACVPVASPGESDEGDYVAPICAQELKTETVRVRKVHVRKHHRHYGHRRGLYEPACGLDAGSARNKEGLVVVETARGPCSL